MPASGTIILGCIIGVISSATQSIGLTLQRKSHLLEEIKLDNHRPPYKRPLWRIGFLLFLIANLLGSSIQITTLPLIILSPLQAIGLVFNSICSSIILHEAFTQLSIIGTILVGFGALFIAAFGSIAEPNHSLKELLDLMQRKQFVSWIIISNTIVVLILIWINVIKLIHSKKFQILHERSSSSNIIRPMFDVSIDKFRFVKGLLYGVISGTLSAHSLLLAKSAVEIIINSIVKKNYNNLQNFKSWIIISSFFILAITQLIFLNKGLKNISTSILYPLVFCIYNITNIINGLVFYNQLKVLTKFQSFMIILGTFLVLLGVFALSWRLEELDPKDHSAAFLKRGSVSTERSGLLSPNMIQTNHQIDGSGGDSDQYVSFGSPKGESPIVIDEEPGYISTDEFEPNTRSPIITSPFKYGSLMDNDQSGIAGSTNQKRRSRRVLSYEQNELLNQLKKMPDV